MTNTFSIWLAEKPADRELEIDLTGDDLEKLGAALVKGDLTVGQVKQYFRSKATDPALDRYYIANEARNPDSLKYATLLSFFLFDCGDVRLYDSLYRLPALATVIDPGGLPEVVNLLPEESDDPDRRVTVTASFDALGNLASFDEIAELDDLAVLEATAAIFTAIEEATGESLPELQLCSNDGVESITVSQSDQSVSRNTHKISVYFPSRHDSQKLYDLGLELWNKPDNTLFYMFWLTFDRLDWLQLLEVSTGSGYLRIYRNGRFERMPDRLLAREAATLKQYPAAYLESIGLAAVATFLDVDLATIDRLADLLIL